MNRRYILSLHTHAHTLSMPPTITTTSVCVCLCVFMWVDVWGANTSIIGVEHSSLKHISTEPTVYQVPQRATQLRKNRYMENQADTKQKRLNWTTRRGDGWEGGSSAMIGDHREMDTQNPAKRVDLQPVCYGISVLPYIEGLLQLVRRKTKDPSWLSGFVETWEMVII